MARHSRKTSAAVSRREREPEQRSRTEKSGASPSKAGQSDSERRRGRATVHEFPGRKREQREKAVRSQQSGAGSSKQSGVSSQEAAQRGKVEDLRRGGAQAEPSREIKSRFAGDGKAAQQGWVEEKSQKVVTSQESGVGSSKRSGVRSRESAQRGRGEELRQREAGEQRGKLKEPKPPFPAQHQPRPGLEAKLQPKPRYEGAQYRAAQKLKDKVALITGGDSGIGRAVAVLYAREGADVAIVYLPEEQVDAEETRRAVKAAGRECLLLPGDVTDPEFCGEAVERAVEEFGKLDILVNNAAFQQHQEKIEDVSNEQFEHTFRTNIFGYFYMAKAALPHMKEGAAIVNCGSITGLRGNKQLLDYASTKGAIHAFTKSLAQNVVERGIRVNCVAPGPVWTPLNVADKEGKEAAEHGKDVPMERPAQPEEIAPAFVFFASEADSSYITGEVLTLLGGETEAA